MTIKHRKSTSRWLIYTTGAAIFLSACAPMNNAARALGELGDILRGTPLASTPIIIAPNAVSTDAPSGASGISNGAATAVATVLAEVLPTVPPPPGYPKNQPWPPVTAVPAPTLLPETQTTPLATQSVGVGGVVAPPSSIGTPVALGATQPISSDAARFVGPLRLVFPHAIGLSGGAKLRVARLNQAENTPVNIESDFPLEFSSVVTGSHLTSLLPSPDGQSIVAEVVSHVSSEFILMDAKTRTNRPLKSVSESQFAPLRFLAWSPDSQRVIIQTSSEATTDPTVVLNVVNQSEILLDYPQAASGLTRLVAAGYSPDGSQLVDALIQPDTFTLELALRPASNTNLLGRRVIKQLPNVADLIERSLQWSFDGKKLAWVMNVQPGPNYKIDTQQTELWVADLSSGEFKRVAILGKGVAYNHVPVWTANSKEIVAIVVEAVTDNRDTVSNIKRFNIASGAAQSLTNFKAVRVSNLTWSRDGLNLTFSVFKEGSLFGEIWFTDVQGINKQQLVSSTPPNAPFAWLP